MQDAGTTEEEADLNLLNTFQASIDDGNYDVNIFLTSGNDNENVSTKSEAFQLKDGINGGRIPRTWVLLDNQ